MTTVSDDDVLLLLSMPYFILSLTVSFLLVLPAGGVFQTEPPGGCLRQALIRNVYSLSSRGREVRFSFGGSILSNSSRIHCGLQNVTFI